MYENVGTKLGAYRRKYKVRQRQIAELAGVTSNHISRVERCLCSPSARILLTYIKEFNIPIEEVLS